MMMQVKNLAKLTNENNMLSPKVNCAGWSGSHRHLRGVYDVSFQADLMTFFCHVRWNDLPGVELAVKVGW